MMHIHVTRYDESDWVVGQWQYKYSIELMVTVKFAIDDYRYEIVVITKPDVNAYCYSCQRYH